MVHYATLPEGTAAESDLPEEWQLLSERHGCRHFAAVGISASGHMLGVLSLAAKGVVLESNSLSRMTSPHMRAPGDASSRTTFNQSGPQPQSPAFGSHMRNLAPLAPALLNGHVTMLQALLAPSRGTRARCTLWPHCWRCRSSRLPFWPTLCPRYTPPIPLVRLCKLWAWRRRRRPGRRPTRRAWCAWRL